MDPHHITYILSEPQFKELVLSTVSKSVDELIDEAINRLPFLRRNIAKRNLARNPRKRAEIADHVLLNLSEDPASQVLFGASIADGIASGAITAQTPITLDIDKIERIIEMILKYLPAILQLFQLFVSIAIFFAAMLAVGSTSSTVLAQGGNCANGVCSLGSRVAAVVGLQPVSDTSPRVATSPISPRIAFVAPRVSAAVNQVRPVAIVANTRQRFEEKPVRKFVGSIRPVRRVASVFRR